MSVSVNQRTNQHNHTSVPDNDRGLKAGLPETLPFACHCQHVYGKSSYIGYGREPYINLPVSAGQLVIANQATTSRP
jgi:hypothetical protein